MEELKAMVKAMMDSIIEVTTRAVNAENELKKVSEYEKIWHNASDRRDAENDALKKEVEQLKAKLNALEGVEEADRGVL